MRILFVSPFDFSCPGGVNEHILHLDAEYRKLGHQTRILAPRSPGEAESDDGHVVKLGVAVPIPANGSTARITLSPFVSGKVKDLLRRERFDIVHLHEPLAPMLPQLALLHSRSVNVGTFHAARAHNWGYLSARPLLSLLFAKLHGRIAVSPAALESIARYFPGYYELIPNGIDVQRFRPDVPPIAQFGRPTLLFVGRFNESRKGLRYLIEALALVRREFPDVLLLVVGPGDPARYARQLERHELVDHVRFTGPVADEVLPAYYTACDVFCAPATGGESFGIVLLEAMASGKPVVATDIRGFRFVLRHGIEGLLVERKNPEVLALALVHLLADPALRERLGKAGRQRAEQFSWAAIAQRTLAYYERLLRGVRETTTEPPIDWWTSLRLALKAWSGR
jgi:phosphatidylinositol alpha-mannosyltransferase